MSANVLKNKKQQAFSVTFFQAIKACLKNLFERIAESGPFRVETIILKNNMQL